jgi:hypothetical protein
MVIMAFMYCFGQKSATNSNGIDFSIVPKMEGGLFVGGVVTILLFGGVAIIVNGVFNKIGILIITIGIAIIMNIVTTIVPFIATTPQKYISKKYGTEMNSSRYIDLEGNYHNTVYSKNNYYDNDGTFHGTKEYAEAGVKETNNAFASYINMGSQISGIFNMFTLDTNFDATANAFGEDYTYKYALRSDEPIVMQNGKFNFDPKLNTFLPNITMSQLTRDYKTVIKYNVYGPSTDDLLIYSLAGMKDDTIAYYRATDANPLQALRTVKFYSGKDMYAVAPENEADIIANIGTYASRNDSLLPGQTPNLIQQFYQYKPYGSILPSLPPIETGDTLNNYFRSIILYDLFANPDSYFYDGDKLGVHIGVNDYPKPTN